MAFLTIERLKYVVMARKKRKYRQKFTFQKAHMCYQNDSINRASADLTIDNLFGLQNEKHSFFQLECRKILIYKTIKNC